MEGTMHAGPQHANAGGHRVNVTEDVLHSTVVRMLSSNVKAMSKAWIIPKEQPIELIFFRNIFTSLRRQTKGEIGTSSQPQDSLAQAPRETDDLSDMVPYEAFMRAFERMFYILGDPGFDAKQFDTNKDGWVSWGEFFQVWKMKNITIRLSLCERIYLTMDNPDSSHLAQVISNLILLTIIVSSLSFVLSTLPECHVEPNDCGTLRTVELCCLLLFILEYVLRFSTCWGVRSDIFDKARLLEMVVGFEPIDRMRPLYKLLLFIVQPSNLIDLAAVLPGVISRVANAQGGAFVVLRLVRLTRILRAFKSPALSEAVRVISKTMQQSTQALYILAFNLMLGIVIFGSLMYMAEGGPELNAFGLGGTWNPSTKVFERKVGRSWDAVNKTWVNHMAESPFQSIPHACWWAITTATTVGYGDMSPTTSLGKLVGVGTMLFSLVILALPVGVIGGTFSNVWEANDHEKKSQELTLKRDMEFVAFEISRLDPMSLANMMLIEVWNDQPGLGLTESSRPPPATFMGEAKLALELLPNQPSSKQCTLQLEENSDIVKRSVSGSITVRCDWTPDACGNDSDIEVTTGAAGGNVQRFRHSMSSIRELKGVLQVTLISADSLINLESTSTKRASSPYCMVLCYPTLNSETGMPEACIWRAPTAKRTLSPEWRETYRFDFSWTPGKSEFNRMGGLEARRRLLARGNSTSSIRSKEQEARAKMEEVLKLAREVGTELQQHRAEMMQVKEVVRALSNHVDQVSKEMSPALPSSQASSADYIAMEMQAIGVPESQEPGEAGASDRAALLPNCIPGAWREQAELANGGL